MISHHEIVHLPSASALAVLRRQDRRQSPGGPPASPCWYWQIRFPTGRAAFSDESARTRGFRPLSPTNPVRLPRLRFSRREAEGLADLLPPGEAKVLLDFEAGRAGLLGAGMEHYRMLHFATHALVDDQRPELTGLALSRFDEQGQPQPAFLRLHEINA